MWPERVWPHSKTLVMGGVVVNNPSGSTYPVPWVKFPEWSFHRLQW